MTYLSESHRISNVECSSVAPSSELSAIPQSNIRPPLSPSAMMLAGVVSFLTFGGAIVATAAVVALQIR
jgi:hypothetical protein